MTIYVDLQTIIVATIRQLRLKQFSLVEQKVFYYLQLLFHFLHKARFQMEILLPIGDFIKHCKMFPSQREKVFTSAWEDFVL